MLIYIVNAGHKRIEWCKSLLPLCFQVAGILEPNDGLCHLDDDGKYTKAEIQVSLVYSNIEISDELKYANNYISNNNLKVKLQVKRKITNLSTF